jgi:hypothetical protein
VTKDPARIEKRAAEAAKLGITEDELRQQRADEDARNLERKAAEAGVSVERYLEDRKRRRNLGNKLRKRASKDKSAKDKG